MSEINTPQNDGRDDAGRFVPGNRGGPGNPMGKRLQELKAVVLDCVTCEQIEAVMRKLHELAISGDVQAAKVWLERVLGRVPQSIIVGPEVEMPDPDKAIADIREILGYKPPSRGGAEATFTPEA